MSLRRFGLRSLVALAVCSATSFAGFASPAGVAQAAKLGEAAPAAPAAQAAVPAEPGQTMATFGDWVVRCERPAPAAPAEGVAKAPAPKRVCEAAQALVIKGQQAPVAQIAFGHLPAVAPVGGKDTPKDAGKDAAKDATRGGGDAGLTLTVLLPVNISFSKPPRLAGSDEGGGTVLTLQRCLPGGCLADARPTAEFLRDLRATAKPGHLSFTDAAERTLTLPLSYRGLSQALDELAREAARDAG